LAREKQTLPEKGKRHDFSSFLFKKKKKEELLERKICDFSQDIVDG